MSWGRTLLLLFILMAAGGFLYLRNNPITAQQSDEQSVEKTPKTQALNQILPSTADLFKRLPALEPKAGANETLQTQQLRILDEVIESRNDNDPRLDKDLKVLSPESKELFKAKYSTLRPEKLNEKGLVIFLLGRNISDSSDISFMQDVLGEAPCLSMGDCAVREETPPPGTEHEEAGNDVSLNYPQLMALKALERALHDDTRLKSDAIKTLEQATHSKIPAIRDLAQSILSGHQG